MPLDVPNFHATRTLTAAELQRASMAALELFPDIEINMELGAEPRLAWIPKDKLVVDRRYQRDVSERRGQRIIRRMLEKFSWRKFQPPTIADLGDGTFAIIDGQHRVEGCKLHPAIVLVPCYIVDAPEVRQQADTFVSINTDRVALNPLQIHHASVAARKPDALHLQEICDKAGVVIPRTTTTLSGGKKPNFLQAPSAVMVALKDFGDTPVLSALTVMVKAEIELRRSVFLAMVQFYGFYRKSHPINDDRIIRVLSNHTAKKLEDAGMAFKSVVTGIKTEVAIRMTLVKEYNKGIRDPAARLPEQL